MSGRPPRVLIVGRGGQLGRELELSLGGYGVVTALGRGEMDLAEEEQIRAAVARAEPDVILNAAAYTAVDRAEREPAVAEAVNVQAPRTLAEEARRCGALLVHYSTDYVFDGTGDRPWVETDEPRPLNVYGRSKLDGEQAVREIGGRYLIFRTSWVYAPHGKNFLLTMLRLGSERDELSVVDDQRGAPTSTHELARATTSVVQQVLRGACGGEEDWAGVYHMSCAGETTWCGFTRAIFAKAGDLLGGRHPHVNAIPTTAYPTPATRPKNSVLDNGKLARRFGVRLAPWEAALDAVLTTLRAGPGH